MLTKLMKFLNGLNKFLNQTFCLHRKEMISHDANRIFLICPDCGRETSGWIVEGKRT